jgi:hypothetical protein
MAFGVSRGLGRPVGEHERLSETTADLVRRADAGDDRLSRRLFSDLALDERAMPPEDVAGIVEAYIKRTWASPAAPPDDCPAQMWLLVARARKRANDETAANAAAMQAAECYAAQAEAFVGRPQGAMLAAH